MLLPVLKIASAICVHLCKISKCYCHVPHKILAVRGWGRGAGGGGERGSRRVVGKDSPVVTWFHIVPWPFALFCIVWGCCCGTQSMARFFLFVFCLLVVGIPLNFLASVSACFWFRGCCGLLTGRPWRLGAFVGRVPCCVALFVLPLRLKMTCALPFLLCLVRCEVPVLKTASAICVHLCKISKCYCQF